MNLKQACEIVYPNMKQYNPDPAHPPSMTPHQVAMQMRTVEQACEQQYHVSDLAMNVASEVWRVRETSVRRVARALQETLVGRISRAEELIAELTDRWSQAWKAAGASGDTTVKEVIDRIRVACLDYAAKERAGRQSMDDVKDWALSLLRRSSVTDWPDKIEYARWVRSVACAAAEGKERWLEELEQEFCERQRTSRGSDA